VIPVFNRPEEVADAIESCLAQSYAPLEVIVVDDGSTDRTGEVLQRFAAHLQVITTANAGVSAARNLGLSRASGDFVQFLDSDDVLLPDSIAERVEMFALFPHVGVVYGRALVPYREELPSSLDLPKDGRALSRLGTISPDTLWGGDYGIPLTNPVPVLYRRAVVGAAGGFDPSLRVHENLELHFRLYLAGVPFLSYNGIAGVYRAGRTRDRLSNAERWDHPDLAHAIETMVEHFLAARFPHDPIDALIRTAVAKAQVVCLQRGAPGLAGRYARLAARLGTSIASE
jgi:glycosyltransferase involved in cell wall biosynthesis